MVDAQKFPQRQGIFQQHISTNGDVGIGTDAPLSKLHVDGGVGSLATGLIFGDGDTGFYIAICAQS